VREDMFVFIPPLEKEYGNGTLDELSHYLASRPEDVKNKDILKCAEC